MIALLQTRADRVADAPVTFAIIFAISAVVVLGVHLWLGKRRRPLVEAYLASHQPDMELIGLRYPPVNLWLRNGRFDSWFKAESSIGVPSWYRVRNGRVDPFE